MKNKVVAESWQTNPGNANGLRNAMLGFMAELLSDESDKESISATHEACNRVVETLRGKFTCGLIALALQHEVDAYLYDHLHVNFVFDNKEEGL